MFDSVIIFSRNFMQIVKTLNYMVQSNGTTIEELSKELRITHRSVFRLLNTIEHKLHIPIEIKRDTFGGIATYKIPSSFIENISNIRFSETPLTFSQSLMVYITLTYLG
jgi:predicted DNA-binding transcriptional regulator YafY